jgi:uncharacterized protein
MPRLWRSKRAARFGEVVTTRKRLRELSSLPSHRVVNKAIDHIDDICRRFIAACPFVIVASRGADGRLDLSPKGDPPGFVAVLDEKDAGNSGPIDVAPLSS